MKKLIIAVCAAAIGLVANAAALSWTTWGYINDGEKETDWISGGQAYLILVSDASSFAVGNDLSITGGKVVDSVALTDGMAYGFWQDTAELKDKITYNFAILFTSDGEAGFVMPTTGYYGVDTNGGDTGKDFYEVTWNANTGLSFSADENSYGGAAITTEVAPEPTSGLLILLGMAGLALKRKQK